MKKLLFIVNPKAGKGAYKANFGETLFTMHSAGIVPTVRFTARRGDATDIAKNESEGYEIICCLGGDGTLSEVIEGVVQIPEVQRPPIGYIPLGTANDVATTLNLPKNNMVGAARRVIYGQPMNFDVGTFGGKGNFTYVAAFGAFTDVSYETPQQEKQALGHFAYVLEGMMRLPKITKYHAKVEYDGGMLEDDFLFGGVMNSTSVAGLIHLNSDKIRLDDGLFELALVKSPRNIADLRAILTDLRERNYDGQTIKLLPTSFARFTFDEPVAWTRDGEEGGAYTEIELRNLKCAVQIIV